MVIYANISGIRIHVLWTSTMEKADGSGLPTAK